MRLAWIVTLKAFANFSPELERSDNPGLAQIIYQTLKGFGGQQTLSGFLSIFNSSTQGSRYLEPWAEISERLRRYQTVPLLFLTSVGWECIRCYCSGTHLWNPRGRN